MDAASNAAFRATSGRPSNGAPDSTPAGDVTQTPTPHSDIIASILATEPDWRFQTPLPTTEEAGPAIPGSQDQSTAPGSDQGDTGTNHNGCTCQTTHATSGTQANHSVPRAPAYIDAPPPHKLDLI